jgi:hypothetical protein
MLLKNDELSVADCTFSYFFAFVIPLVFAFELVEGSCPPLLLVEAPCCIPLLEVKADPAPCDYFNNQLLLYHSQFGRTGN